MQAANVRAPRQEHAKRCKRSTPPHPATSPIPAVPTTNTRRPRRLQRSIGGPSLGGIIPSGRVGVKLAPPTRAPTSRGDTDRRGCADRVAAAVHHRGYLHPTVGQVEQLVGGLDAETALAGAHEVAPDDVPSFEAWARPERLE
jgi:hypothetical protein